MGNQRMFPEMGLCWAIEVVKVVRCDWCWIFSPAKDKIDDPKACQDRVDKVKAMFKKMLSAEKLFVLFYSLSGSLFIGGLKI